MQKGTFGGHEKGTFGGDEKNFSDGRISQTSDPCLTLKSAIHPFKGFVQKSAPYLG